MMLKLELVFVLAMASTVFCQILEVRQDICHNYPYDEPFSVCGFSFYDLYGCICTKSQNKYYQLVYQNSENGESLRRYLRVNCRNSKSCNKLS